MEEVKYIFSDLKELTIELEKKLDYLKQYLIIYDNRIENCSRNSEEGIIDKN